MNVHNNVETGHESQRAEVLMTQMHDLCVNVKEDGTVCSRQQAKPWCDTQIKHHNLKCITFLGPH